MAPSEAKKRANKKYQAKNIASLACRVKIDQAEKFKAYCANSGATSNAVLKDFVLNCIGEQESPQEAVIGPPAAPAGGGISLPSDTIKAAQEAAKAAGETVPVFIARAVETQAQRDEIGRRMKKAPGKKSEA